jgi:nondiscriminating aspartyl-tRNA synthetase
VTEPQITLLGEPAQAPPVELWRPNLDAGLPTILDHAAVSWRHPARRARWDLAAASLRAFRAALDGLGFTEIQTPKFVSSATESGASVFRVDYFGRPAYLAQSPQFYKQTMVGVFERVYETGPVFRAEPHDTARHLAEYVSLDAELGFISDHRDVLAVLRHALAGMTAAVSERPHLGVSDSVISMSVHWPGRGPRRMRAVVGASDDLGGVVAGCPAVEGALARCWARAGRRCGRPRGSAGWRSRSRHCGHHTK